MANKVLIIDDAAYFSRRIAELLTRLRPGTEVHAVTSWEDLTAGKTDEEIYNLIMSFDLLLLDHYLDEGKFDGREIYRRLDAISNEFASTKVLGISSETEQRAYLPTRYLGSNIAFIVERSINFLGIQPNEISVR